MPKLSSERYRTEAIHNLASQQVRFAPAAVRTAQIERVELLMLELSGEEIAYSELSERITRYRSEQFSEVMISRDDALHDLRCFLEDLSSSSPQSVADLSEPVLTMEAVAERWNVSVKTVRRWRDRGMPTRHFTFPDGRRLGVRESIFESFSAQHRNEIERGTRFSNLAESEQAAVLRKARRLASVGGSQTEIIRRLARRMNRSEETIRLLLQKHDESHPSARIIPNRRSPLSKDERREIFESVRRGISLRIISNQFGRSRSTIARIAIEYHRALILEQRIRFIPSPDFEDFEMSVEDSPSDSRDTVPRERRILEPSAPPERILQAANTGSISADEERTLFLKMNFFLFQAAKSQSFLRHSRKPLSEIAEIEASLARSTEIRNELVRHFQPLIFSVVKKHHVSPEAFLDAVGESNLVLLQAIETFDYTRGNRFSTYVTWALMRSFARIRRTTGSQTIPASDR